MRKLLQTDGKDSPFHNSAYQVSNGPSDLTCKVYARAKFQLRHVPRLRPLLCAISRANTSSDMFIKALAKWEILKGVLLRI